MKDILKKLEANDFESSSHKTPEFTSFARKFKNALKKELATINAEITAYNVGHFYVCGFFRIGEAKKCYYFSISDVRHDFGTQMMYRTAKDEKDYTGGSNQYVDINEGMARKMRVFPL